MKTWQRAVLFGLSLCVALVPAHALGETAPDTQPLSISRSLAPVILIRPREAPLPQQERPHPLDDALYLSIAGYRTFDYLSTRDALANGAHEAVLPQWVVDHSETFLAFEGIATATEVESSVWLIHHHHRRLARTMNILSIGAGVGIVVHNYGLPRR
jgi:DNA-binding transcriptional LysR family regulator